MVLLHEGHPAAAAALCDAIVRQESKPPLFAGVIGLLAAKRGNLPGDVSTPPDATARGGWWDDLTLHLRGRLGDDELLACADRADASVRDERRSEAHYLIAWRRRMAGDEEGAREHFRLAAGLGGDWLFTRALSAAEVAAAKS